MALPEQAKALAEAGLTDNILLPEQAAFTERNASYYDNGNKLHPACILQPRTAEQVAAAVKALASAGQQFAIRGGGHGTQTGINNIDKGVTVDLGLLNNIVYDNATEVAHLGAGAKWLKVYDELEKHNRTVGGGRIADVGVGGYLLGGGISFNSVRDGFACDNIVSYQVVLADGSIVTASAEEYSDLFLVLKGGGNNFGIVTSFGMKTLPINSRYWGLMAGKTVASAPDGAKALQKFTAAVADEPENSLIYVVVNVAALGGETVLATTVNTTGKEHPAIFDDFKAMPDVLTIPAAGNMQKMLPFAELPLDLYNIWYTLTFKNDLDIINKTTDLFYELSKELQAKLSPEEFGTYCAFQPLPRAIWKRSTELGGNVLGLDDYRHDTILIQAAVSVKSIENVAWARPKVKALVDEVRDFAGEDRICPWLYMNYCDVDQKPLESYGAQNLQKIRAAATKYDPDGVFQTLCPGGFKISKVQN